MKKNKVLLRNPKTGVLSRFLDLLGNRILHKLGKITKTLVTRWVEREGEEIIKHVEKKRGAVPERVSGTEHYDILSKNDSEVRFIEVKTSTLSNRIRIKLTESERDFVTGYIFISES